MVIHPISRPDELLAVLPYQLGYHPHRSLVIVGLNDNRVRLLQRFDTDVFDVASQDEETLALACDHVEDALRVLIQAGTELVVPVVYESRPGDGDRLLGHLLDWFARLGIPVVDPLWVRDGRWGLLLDPTGSEPTLASRLGGAGEWEAGDTPDRGGLEDRPEPAFGWAEQDGDPMSVEGAPLPDPSRVASVADFVGLGYAPAASRDQLAELVTPPEGDPRSRAVARSVRSRLARQGAPAVPRHATLAAWRRLLSSAAAPQPEDRLRAQLPSPADVAAMATSLTHPQWRDGMLAWLCPGTVPLEDLLPQVADAVRRLPRPTGMACPDAPALAAVRRLEAALQCLCQALPDEAGPATTATLTVTAHLAWWRGDGTLARVCLDRALTVDPDYRLAVLLQRLVDHGLSTRGPVRPGRVPAPSRDEVDLDAWWLRGNGPGLDASA